MSAVRPPLCTPWAQQLCTHPANIPLCQAEVPREK